MSHSTTTSVCCCLQADVPARQQQICAHAHIIVLIENAVGFENGGQCVSSNWETDPLYVSSAAARIRQKCSLLKNYWLLVCRGAFAFLTFLNSCECVKTWCFSWLCDSLTQHTATATAKDTKIFGTVKSRNSLTIRSLARLKSLQKPEEMVPRRLPCVYSLLCYMVSKNPANQSACGKARPYFVFPLVTYFYWRTLRGFSRAHAETLAQFVFRIPSQRQWPKMSCFSTTITAGHHYSFFVLVSFVAV